MSDYERINMNVKANLNSIRNKAFKGIVNVLVRVVVALGAIAGLKAIGFISASFMVILMAVAICVGTFKIGYISRDIKY